VARRSARKRVRRVFSRPATAPSPGYAGTKAIAGYQWRQRLDRARCHGARLERSSPQAGCFAALRPDGVRAIVREELEPVETRLTSIESEVRSIRGELDDLSEKFDNVSGFRKEIDHALERIAAIEEHRRMKKKMAA
jgi:hypothetical protein